MSSLQTAPSTSTATRQTLNVHPSPHQDDHQASQIVIVSRDWDGANFFHTFKALLQILTAMQQLRILHHVSFALLIWKAVPPANQFSPTLTQSASVNGRIPHPSHYDNWALAPQIPGPWASASVVDSSADSFGSWTHERLHLTDNSTFRLGATLPATTIPPVRQPHGLGRARESQYIPNPASNQCNPASSGSADASSSPVVPIVPHSPAPTSPPLHSPTPIPHPACKPQFLLNYDETSYINEQRALIRESDEDNNPYAGSFEIDKRVTLPAAQGFHFPNASEDVYEEPHPYIDSVETEDVNSSYNGTSLLTQGRDWYMDATYPTLASDSTMAWDNGSKDDRNGAKVWEGAPLTESPISVDSLGIEESSNEASLWVSIADGPSADSIRHVPAEQPSASHVTDEFLSPERFRWIFCVMYPKLRGDRSRGAPSGPCILCGVVCRRAGALHQHVLFQHRWKIVTDYLSRRPLNLTMALAFTVLELVANDKLTAEDDECLKFENLLSVQGGLEPNSVTPDDFPLLVAKFREFSNEVAWRGQTCPYCGKILQKDCHLEYHIHVCRKNPRNSSTEKLVKKRRRATVTSKDGAPRKRKAM